MESVLNVSYEPLGLGPAGDRVSVIDFEPTDRHFYEPVDLDDVEIAISAGLPPDERDPRFHQQMVYAVSSSVLDQFDRALGHRIRYRYGPLAIYPHAFYGANAYYIAQTNSIAFGYFEATEQSQHHRPGQMVFTCLSHDIIAHEVTHSLVHRLRPYFSMRTNSHVAAFHEAIADIVAVFMHFKLEGVLERALATSHSSLDSTSVLVELAAQAGYARGDDGALRSAVRRPDQMSLARASNAHDRGAILLAAMFDAFVAGYRARAERLITIATGGSGLLAPGHLDPRLRDELAAAAREVADRILLVCIRAFDYLPPTDVTFGDFVRALVTADYDVYAGDESGLRASMIEAFRRHGITPEGVFSLAEHSLIWDASDAGMFTERMPTNANHVLSEARAERRHLAPASEGVRDPAVSKFAREWREQLESWADKNRGPLGLNQGTVQVRHFHVSFRFDEDRQARIDAVVQFTQTQEVTVGASDRPRRLRSGATIVADAASGDVRFVIAKPPYDATAAGRMRLDALNEFVNSDEINGDETSAADADPLLIDHALLHGEPR